jgi:alkylhydroperoxidase family enzyme
MARIDEVSFDDAPEGVRAIYRACQAVYGQVLTPVAVAAHNVEVMNAMLSFELAVQPAAALSERLKRLVDAKVASSLGCPFCVDISSALSLDAGISAQLLAQLPRFRESSEFSAAELAALAYCEAMTSASAEVSDELFCELQRHFNAAQLVELTAAIAWENFRSRFNLALRVQDRGFCSKRS